MDVVTECWSARGCAELSGQKSVHFVDPHAAVNEGDLILLENGDDPLFGFPSGEREEYEVELPQFIRIRS